MLRFRIHQIYIHSVHSNLIPLPKLTDPQLGILSGHLQEHDFNVRVGSKPNKRIALRGNQRISIDGELGLASSSVDMLDPIAPAVPGILAAPRVEGGSEARERVADRYFSLKSSGASVELQLFPRMESLRMWTNLREEGLSGLTPDEAVVIKHALGNASSASSVRCVTAQPRSGSRRLQVGRKLYYESVLSVSEFLSSLRTIDSGQIDSASYLPRDSIFVLSRLRLDTSLAPDELGEWCG